MNTEYLNLLEKVILCSLWEQRKFNGYGTAVGIMTPTDYETGEGYPEHALTMVGAKRLRNIRDLCERVVAENIPGGFCECGVWRGGCCIYARACLPLNRTIYVCDSFDGFPSNPNEPWWEELVFLKVLQGEVRDNFNKLDLYANVKLIPGLFDSSLHLVDGPLAILRLDGDSYVNTMTCLRQLWPKLSADGFLIVDDYGIVPECKKAFDEFFKDSSIHINTIDQSGIWLQKQP